MLYQSGCGLPGATEIEMPISQYLSQGATMNEAVDPYDEAFEEGVQNWNLLVLKAAIHRDRMLQAILLLPEAARAFAKYARTRYLGMISTEEVFERYRLLFAAKDAMDAEGYWAAAPWNEWAEKWVHAAAELALRNLSLDDSRAPRFEFLSYSERYRPGGGGEPAYARLGLPSDC